MFKALANPIFYERVEYKCVKLEMTRKRKKKQKEF